MEHTKSRPVWTTQWAAVSKQERETNVVQRLYQLWGLWTPYTGLRAAGRPSASYLNEPYILPDYQTHRFCVFWARSDHWRWGSIIVIIFIFRHRRHRGGLRHSLHILYRKNKIIWSEGQRTSETGSASFLEGTQFWPPTPPYESLIGLRVSTSVQSSISTHSGCFLFPPKAVELWSAYRSPACLLQSNP